MTGKIAGVDNLPAEFVQAGGGYVVDVMTITYNKLEKRGLRRLIPKT